MTVDPVVGYLVGALQVLLCWKVFDVLKGRYWSREAARRCLLSDLPLTLRRSDVEDSVEHPRPKVPGVEPRLAVGTVRGPEGGFSIGNLPVPDVPTAAPTPAQTPTTHKNPYDTVEVTRDAFLDYWGGLYQEGEVSAMSQGEIICIECFLDWLVKDTPTLIRLPL